MPDKPYKEGRPFPEQADDQPTKAPPVQSRTRRDAVKLSLRCTSSWMSIR